VSSSSPAAVVLAKDEVVNTCAAIVLDGELGCIAVVEKFDGEAACLLGNRLAKCVKCCRTSIRVCKHHVEKNGVLVPLGINNYYGVGNCIRQFPRASESHASIRLARASAKMLSAWHGTAVHDNASASKAIFCIGFSPSAPQMG
jgi:hypothetical protein